MKEYSVNILIIEDKPNIAKYLQQSLVDSGFFINLTSSGNDGLFLAEVCSHDLLIIDVILQDMTGWELLEKLRSQGDESPVIFLTSTEGRSFDFGDTLDEVKPFSFLELLARVRAILQKGNNYKNDISILPLHMDCYMNSVESKNIA
tara:strand:- start:25588 stop:26028 length:441 start_codon:yes stop_codon:yes gene_type:complete